MFMNQAIPASLAKLHGRTDTEGLVLLLPLLLEFRKGFTAAALNDAVRTRNLFPDFEESQLIWKMRRSLNAFEKVGYVERTLHAWYVPDVEKIQAECEDAARALTQVLTEVTEQRQNLLQAALMGPGGAQAHPQTGRPEKASNISATKGLKGLAAKAKKGK